MFKLFKNFLPAESTKDSDSALATSQPSSQESWETQVAQADILWEQGKLSEALAIYGLAIEQNPKSPEIQQRLAGHLKQQGDLAIAYEQLATNLKNQGKTEQAADYYRQAIHIKAITGNTTEQLYRSSISQVKRTPIPFAKLKEVAFSFQPLLNANSQIVKFSDSAKSGLNIEVESSNKISPNFSSRIKAINPQQAKDIDWETAQVYLQKALDHLERQEWEKSALACKQAIKIMPNTAEAYKIWGNALQRMGNTAEAMSCYAKAVEIEPNLAEVYAGLGDIYLEQDKLQQAIKHYQKAIIIKPSGTIYRSLAKVWRRLGDLEQAQTNISKALKLESLKISVGKSKRIANSKAIVGERSKSVRTVEVYCSMARQSEQQNEWQQAAQYYRKALDVSMALPALPPAKSDLDKTKLEGSNKNDDSYNLQVRQPRELTRKLTQLDRAIQRYHKQSKLQPNSPKIHTDLGNLYCRKRKWQYAITCYRKAISIQPQYANARLGYARVLLKIGKKAEFINEMKLALNIKPKIGTALDRFYLANALADEGQDREALSFYCKAIALKPKFIQAYHRVSDLLSKQNKHEQAIEFLKQCINQNSQDAESFYLLGQQLELKDDWDNAVKTFGKVLQLEPQFPGASQKLNHALAKKLTLSKARS